MNIRSFVTTGLIWMVCIEQGEQVPHQSEGSSGEGEGQHMQGHGAETNEASALIKQC